MKAFFTTKAITLQSCLFALAAGAFADAEWLGMAWACGAVAFLALGAAMLSYLNAKPHVLRGD